MKNKKYSKFLIYGCLFLLIAGGITYITRTRQLSIGFAIGPRAHKKARTSAINKLEKIREMQKVSKDIRALDKINFEVSGNLPGGPSFKNKLGQRIASFINELRQEVSFRDVGVMMSPSIRYQDRCAEDMNPYAVGFEDIDLTRVPDNAGIDWVMPNVTSQAQVNRRLAEIRTFFVESVWRHPDHTLYYHMEQAKRDYEEHWQIMYDLNWVPHPFGFDKAVIGGRPESTLPDEGNEVALTVFHARRVSADVGDPDYPQIWLLYMPLYYCDFPNLETPNYTEEQVRNMLEENDWTIAYASTLTMWNCIQFIQWLDYGGYMQNYDDEGRFTFTDENGEVICYWDIKFRVNDMFYKSRDTGQPVVFGSLFSIREIEQSTPEGDREVILRNFPWFVMDLKVNLLAYLLDQSECERNFDPCLCDHIESFSTFIHQICGDDYTADPCYDYSGEGC